MDRHAVPFTLDLAPFGHADTFLDAMEMADGSLQRAEALVTRMRQSGDAPQAVAFAEEVLDRAQAQAEAARPDLAYLLAETLVRCAGGGWRDARPRLHLHDDHDGAEIRDELTRWFAPHVVDARVRAPRAICRSLATSAVH